jgi:hypothetical protein
MRNHDTSRDEDTELRRIAHALVAEAPPAPASLPVLKPAPRRASRYGRLVPVLAAATVVVAAVGTLLLSTAGEAPKTVDKGTANPPAQRLFLSGWPEEVLADGSVVDVPTGGIDRLGLDGMPQPLPGGRFVVLGVRNVSDRSSGEAPVLVLNVVNADGTVEMEREVQRADGSVSLLAALPDAAILGRYEGGETRIVRHDLQSGKERLVAKTNLKAYADVAGDRLALAGTSAAAHAGSGFQADGCRLDLIDLIGGHRTAYNLPTACSETRGVRVSPDGEFAAVVYGVVRAAPEPELRLAIVDLADSTIHSDGLLGHNLICAPTECADIRPVDYLGLAWGDDRTVRVALVDLRADPGWNPEGHRVPQRALIIETRTIR